MIVIPGNKRKKITDWLMHFQFVLLFFFIAVALHFVFFCLFHPTSYDHKVVNEQSNFTQFIQADSPEILKLSYDLYYNDPEVLIHPEKKMGFNYYRSLTDNSELPEQAGLPDYKQSDILNVSAQPAENFVYYEKFQQNISGYAPLHTEMMQIDKKNLSKDSSITMAYPVCLDVEGNTVPLDFSEIQKFVSADRNTLQPSVYTVNRIDVKKDPDITALTDYVRVSRSSGNLHLDRKGKNVLAKFLKNPGNNNNGTLYIILWRKPPFHLQLKQTVNDETEITEQGVDK